MAGRAVPRHRRLPSGADALPLARSATVVLPSASSEAWRLLAAAEEVPMAPPPRIISRDVVGGGGI